MIAVCNFSGIPEAIVHRCSLRKVLWKISEKEESLWYQCFSVKFTKFFRKAFLQNTSRWWREKWIRSIFWPIFSCIESEYRKIRTRKNPVFGHFSRGVLLNDRMLSFSGMYILKFTQVFTIKHWLSLFTNYSTINEFDIYIINWYKYIWRTSKSLDLMTVRVQ